MTDSSSSDQPVVLLTHLLMGDGTEALAAEIDDRLPEVDLRVCHDEEATFEHATEAEVIITQRFTDELFAAAPRLAWVQALSAGVDHYDLAGLRDAGVVVTNTSGVHAQPIGEQVLGYLLHFARRFDRAVAQQHEGQWKRYRSAELADATVCIVGVGAIGTRVAELLDAVGATTVGVKRDPSTAPACLDRCVTPDRLHDALADADYLVLACPLTDATRELVDAQALTALPDTAVVVNIARGEVVDQSALVAALQRGTIGGAALDVFEEEPLPDDSPLWEMSNVLITPHVAGLTPHYWERAADIVAENYHRYVAGEPLYNRQN